MLTIERSSTSRFGVVSSTKLLSILIVSKGKRVR